MFFSCTFFAQKNCSWPAPLTSTQMDGAASLVSVWMLSSPLPGRRATWKLSGGFRSGYVIGLARLSYSARVEQEARTGEGRQKACREQSPWA